ncbi:MAG: hypothetical protein GEU86_19560 [Actinophytocola sp.]|nr:hypothetical protein [Actinophytocola sp.]
MRASPVVAAGRELAALTERLGLRSLPDTSGWAPTLLAAVDQHAAAVRDILLLSSGSLGSVELAAYARGIQDVALEGPWRPSHCTKDADWGADWVNLRLAAVCLLAVAGTVAMTVGGGEAGPSLFF